MSSKPHRIAYLDGLRGLAILLVLGFHYVGSTYAAKFPYGSALAGIPILDHGWVGVYLFFLISGYVIFMTLEKCATARQFLQRRWLRLFPALLIASIVIFTFSQFFGADMPSGSATLIDFLPGLTFIGDAFWHAGLNHTVVRSLDGDFWTLYVEAGFYLVISPLYFQLGWKRALLFLTLFWIAVLSAPTAISHLPKSPLHRAIEPFQWFGVQYYGWFAAGALFYKAKEFGSSRLFGLAVLVATAAALTWSTKNPAGVIDYVYLLACVAIFAAIQRWHGLQAIFQNRFALFVGLISYPLYLLHNEIGIGLMGLIGPHFPRSALPFLPLPLTAVMLLLAWLVTKYIEPRIRDMLKRCLQMLDRPPTRSVLAKRKDLSL